MSAAYEAFIQRMKKAGSVRVYGAGKFARSLYLLLARVGVAVEAFVTAEPERNPSEFCGRPVWGLEENKATQNKTRFLVVGLEQKPNLKEAVNMLLARQTENIVMISPDIVNEIYCNFIMDGTSAEALCDGLKQERQVILYANDGDIRYVFRYFQAEGVRIHAVCTDLQELPQCLQEEELEILSLSQLDHIDKNSTIVLTMGEPTWQRAYINPLRKKGFERIVLISKELKEKFREEHASVIWEAGSGGRYRVICAPDAEKGHHIIQRDVEGHLFRWRIPEWDQAVYGARQVEAVRKDEIYKGFLSQYPGFCYYSCDEAPLCEIWEGSAGVSVYMAKFHGDKKTKQAALPDWVIPIQAGAALTDQRVAALCDNTGDHISGKNGDYSEGTALYWVWKNTQGQEYVGLFHYRRQMTMDLDSLQVLRNYDVLLTVPTYVSMCIKDFFCGDYILEYDWNLMMRFIGEYDQAYYETALAYEKAHCYFPCNIFIMKRKYFDEMCSFIFGITEKVDAFYQNMGLVRKDRYMGFLVENLLSIYIMHHGSRLKGAYMDMKYYAPLED